jgi:hypothetical protein
MHEPIERLVFEEEKALAEALARRLLLACFTLTGDTEAGRPVFSRPELEVLHENRRRLVNKQMT